MAKTYKNLFAPALRFTKLLEAHKRARKGKRLKGEVIEFEMDLESNIMSIMRELKSREYSPGEYNEFYIYEPKQRLIKAAPYRDRVVHQWHVEEFVKPVFQKAFIFDSYACLDGKGMHGAAFRVQEFLKRAQNQYPDPYALKIDVRKYFFSIDHETLYNIVASKIKDEDVLWLTRVILNTSENPGIPIGSYTSQFFANVYLHELDMFAKHQLRIKKYVRYMDDSIFILEDKQKARDTLKQIEKFLWERLRLKLNAKTQIMPAKNGANFCGYKIKSTHLKIRDSSKRRIKRKLKKLQEKYRKGDVELEDIKAVMMSWKGYAQHADSYDLINTIFSRFIFTRDK